MTAVPGWSAVTRGLLLCGVIATGVVAAGAAEVGRGADGRIPPIDAPGGPIDSAIRRRAAAPLLIAGAAPWHGGLRRQGAAPSGTPAE